MENIDIESKKMDAALAQGTDIASEYLKLLANSNRLIILNHLLDGEACVGEIEKLLLITQSALSQHLSRMHDEGILSRRRDSQQIIYKIKDQRVKKILKLIFKIFNINKPN